MSKLICSALCNFTQILLILIFGQAGFTADQSAGTRSAERMKAEALSLIAKQEEQKALEAEESNYRRTEIEYVAARWASDLMYVYKSRALNKDRILYFDGLTPDWRQRLASELAWTVLAANAAIAYGDPLADHLAIFNRSRFAKGLLASRSFRQQVRNECRSFRPESEFLDCWQKLKSDIETSQHLGSAVLVTSVSSFIWYGTRYLIRKFARNWLRSRFEPVVRIFANLTGRHPWILPTTVVGGIGWSLWSSYSALEDERDQMKSAVDGVLKGIEDDRRAMQLRDQTVSVMRWNAIQQEQHALRMAAWILKNLPARETEEPAVGANSWGLTTQVVARYKFLAKMRSEAPGFNELCVAGARVLETHKLLEAELKAIPDLNKKIRELNIKPANLYTEEDKLLLTKVQYYSSLKLVILALGTYQSVSSGPASAVGVEPLPQVRCWN